MSASTGLNAVPFDRFVSIAVWRYVKEKLVWVSIPEAPIHHAELPDLVEKDLVWAAQKVVIGENGERRHVQLVRRKKSPMPPGKLPRVNAR